MSARGARFEAKQKGNPYYWTGLPCKNGHIDWRRTASGLCQECRRETDRAKYAADPNKYIAKTQKFYQQNAEQRKAKRRARYAMNPKREKEIARVRSMEWRKNNPDKVKNQKIIKQAYKLANPHKTLALTAKRRAAKKCRTPKWLTSDDFWMIEETYNLAVRRRDLTGFAWHVDHIVPLQGKQVSGLHVPWNLQVIPWRDNLRKGNK